MRCRYWILGVIVLLFSQCDSISNESLEGKWSVSQVSVSGASDAAYSDDIERELRSMVFDFKSDGLMLHSDFFRTGALGKWKLSNDADSLICEYLYKRATYTDNYSISRHTDGFILTSDAFQGVDHVTIIITEK